MRIAMLVDSFLPVSETFILRQITGLAERGESVDIFAQTPAEPSNVNQDAVRMLEELVSSQVPLTPDEQFALARLYLDASPTPSRRRRTD